MRGYRAGAGSSRVLSPPHTLRIEREQGRQVEVHVGGVEALAKGVHRRGEPVRRDRLRFVVGRDEAVVVRDLQRIEEGAEQGLPVGEMQRGQERRGQRVVRMDAAHEVVDPLVDRQLADTRGPEAEGVGEGLIGLAAQLRVVAVHRAGGEAADRFVEGRPQAGRRQLVQREVLQQRHGRR